jgi:DNA-binding NtrC family response regulator
MQSKLLRVLQEGEFERVGGNRTLKVDVRVVAATNRELERDVDGGRFRADLFWRLCVVPVVLPPLRERRDEIVPLARHFLRPGLELSPDAEELLRQAPWPGNVRELQNVIERAGLLCQGTVIEAATLQPWLGPARAGAPLPAAVLVPYDPFAALAGRTLQSVEQELIRRTLERCGGNRTRTAELLGISVRSLFDRLKSVAAERG